MNRLGLVLMITVFVLSIVGCANGGTNRVVLTSNDSGGVDQTIEIEACDTFPLVVHNPSKDDMVVKIIEKTNCDPSLLDADGQPVASVKVPPGYAEIPVSINPVPGNGGTHWNITFELTWTDDNGNAQSGTTTVYGYCKNSNKDR